MAVTALIGAQWGDEGKGKIIDILAQNADVVVRAQGGNNAGHTVVCGDQTYKLRLMPSGILYKDTVCVVGNGTVVDPKVLLEEIDALTARGISVANLKIDARAHVIMPYHIVLDGLSEKARGSGDIGTTKRGIGPAYMDKDERSGIRIYDLMDSQIFKSKLEQNLSFKNRIISEIYGAKPLDCASIYQEYSAYATRLKPYVADTSIIIYEAAKAGKNVLLEGAQGTLLDIDMGTYPFVTSSHPVSGGFCIGAGIGPTLIDNVIGIAKAYTTRVGKGPFPTELNDDIGEKICAAGLEYGTVTGRKRRCGWLDAVILRYAVRINGLTSLAINKLDTLKGIDPLNVCVAYECDGKTTRHFPADIAELSHCSPVYEQLSGFNEDISAVRHYDDLPSNAKKYIEFIEKQCNCHIGMVGVGPDRDQNLIR